MGRTLLAVLAVMSALSRCGAFDAASLAERFLADPQVVPGLRPTRLTKPPKPSGPPRPDDGPRVTFGVSSPGLVSDEFSPALLKVDPARGAVVQFEAPVPRYCPAAALPRDELRRRALAFCARWCPEEQYETLTAKWCEPRPGEIGRTGTLDFHAMWHRNGVQLGWFSAIQVRVWDGKIAGLYVSRSRSLPDLTPAVSRQEAEATARAAIAEMGQVGDRLCSNLIVPGPAPGEPAEPAVLLYQFAFAVVRPKKARTPYSPTAVYSIVNAVTGKPAGGVDCGMRPADFLQDETGRPPLRRHEPLLADCWPTWFVRPDGTTALAFTSRRSRPGTPRWRNEQPAVYAVGPAGGPVWCLASSLDTEWGRLTSAAGRLLCAVGEWQKLGWADPATGNAQLISAGGKNIRSPALDAEGKRLAMVRGAGARGEALWVGEVANRAITHQRALNATGDHLSAPAWSRREPSLYYARLTLDLEHGHETDILRTSGAPALGEAKQPEVVVSGLPEIERISCAPEDALLLVQTADHGGVLLADPAQHSVRPWPAPAGLRPSGAMLSPDGQRVAFSAFVGSGRDDRLDSECLFACRLDGTDLRQVTPTDDVLTVPLAGPDGKRCLLVTKDDEPLLGKVLDAYL